MRLTHLSPLELRFLLHHRYATDAWPEPSPAAEEALQRFLKEGLLYFETRKPFETALVLTDKGDFYLNTVLSTPFPETVTSWSISHTATGRSDGK